MTTQLEDTVAQQARHIKALSEAIIDLRSRNEQLEKNQKEAHSMAIEASWNASYAEQGLLALQEKERNKEAELAAKYGADLVPSTDITNKLPERYSDKNFWWMSLPLTHTTIFLKRVGSWLSSFVISPDASVEATRRALEEAHRERDLLNIIRVQRKVDKIKRSIQNSIRKNKNSITKRVGRYTPENEVAAMLLQQHFFETGLCDRIGVTTDNEKIYIHIDITYGE